MARKEYIDKDNFKPFTLTFTFDNEMEVKEIVRSIKEGMEILDESGREFFELAGFLSELSAGLLK